MSAEALDRTREAYTALRESAGVHRLPRDVVSVSGPDAASYLQGQCSQDVLALQPGAGAEALLLSPQGKIDVYLRVTRVSDDRFVLDTDEGFGAATTQRLERFRLRTKVTIEPLDWECVGLRGPEAAERVIGAPELVLPVEWEGLSGVDLLGPAPAGGWSTWVDDQAVPCDDAGWDAARIEAGVPVNGQEVVEGSIAAELGLVDRTVSFTKGCFTGQELVARLDARGSNVPWRLSGVVFDGGPDDPRPQSGAPVFDLEGSRDVGRLTSVAWSPGLGCGVALVRLHRSVTPPTGVLLRWEDADGSRSLEAEARPLPLVRAS
jgi:folate-binding protein YgfZ